MKIVKSILIGVLCLSITVTTGFALYNNRCQNDSGKYSSVTIITDKERQWILDRFGREYDCIEEYILTVQSYTRKNFRYDYNKKSLFQYFDFENIVDTDRITGICFDFAVMFKHITLLLYENGFIPVENLKVYVVDVKFENPSIDPHSYNVMVVNDAKYYIDLTISSVRAEKGLNPVEDYEVFNCSIEDYCTENNEILINLH